MSSTMANVNDLIDDDEDGLSGFTILAIFVTLLVVFFLVVWYAYQQGKASASASEELPVVAADPRPVAEDVPLDAAREGTRQEVYDRVSGALPTRIVTAEDPAADPLDGYSGAPAAMSERAEAAAEPEPVRSRDQMAAALEQATPQVVTTTPPSRKPVQESTAAAVPQRQAPVRAEPAPARASTATAAAGTHVVQVGAFDSSQAALDYFDTLSGRLGALVADKRPDIQVADVKGRTYHRLRIGPFTSKTEADRYCASLKSRGQDCLVRGV